MEVLSEDIVEGYKSWIYSGDEFWWSGVVMKHLVENIRSRVRSVAKVKLISRLTKTPLV